MNPLRRWYERSLFPWLHDRFVSLPVLERLRAEGLVEARGRLVEIGFGTGLNLPHYPAAVTSLAAVEINPGMVRRAAARIEAFPGPVEVVPAAAEQLPFQDGAFDTAVSFLTLCSVADPGRALAELRRVLRDDGILCIMEHGLAEDEGIARWQRRLTPLERMVAGDCRLDRPVAALVAAAGFRFATERCFFVPEIPRTHGWFTVGVAVKA